MNLIKIVNKPVILDNDNFESIYKTNKSILEILKELKEHSLDIPINTYSNEQYILADEYFISIDLKENSNYDTDDSRACWNKEDIKIKYIKLDRNRTETINNVVESDDVVFISTPYLRKLSNGIDSRGLNIYELSEKNCEDKEKISDIFDNDSASKLLELKKNIDKSVKETIAKLKNISQDENIVKRNEFKVDECTEEGIINHNKSKKALVSNEGEYNMNNKKNTEREFIKNLKELTLSEGLIYSNLDLCNLHTSILSSKITVLAGSCGTGKTQIARAYAKTLGATEENNRLAFIPIKPSYTEPRDLLGYINPTTGLYIPSDNRFLDILIDASRDKKNLYVIVFDEMNLAQVEYWFAPLLSLLEIDINNRILKLYSDNQICHNKYEYPSEVHIGDNIIFIGTINSDNTTKDFSDRVLDRVSMLTLSRSTIDDLTGATKYEIEALPTVTYEEFNDWKYKNSIIGDLPIGVIELLDDINIIMDRELSSVIVSSRTALNIAKFINNGKEYFEGIDSSVYIDLALLQNFLVRIKGTDLDIKNIVEEMIKLLEKSEVSNFNYSKKYLERKLKELYKYGYSN